MKNRTAPSGSTRCRTSGTMTALESGATRKERWTGASTWYRSPPPDHPDASPHAALRRVVGSKPVRDGRLVELRRPAVRVEPVRPLHPVAANAVELAAQHRGPPRLGQGPRAHREGRSMAHVLTMAAVEICDPVSKLVEMEAHDRALHGVIVPGARRGGREDCSQHPRRAFRTRSGPRRSSRCR